MSDESRELLLPHVQRFGFGERGVRAINETGNSEAMFSLLDELGAAHSRVRALMRENLDLVTDLSAARKHNERTCQWRYMDWPESSSDYETECGAAWTFIDGGIEKNDQRFCSKCGGRVLAPAKPAPDEDDEEASV